jgi:uncharacterized OsmC-like protein
LNIYINNDDILEIIIINELGSNDISFKKLKSNVKEKFKGYVSDKKIKYLIKKNNLKCKTAKITKEIGDNIIDTFLIQKTITAFQMSKIILDKYLIKISETSIYSILKKNNITYKKLKVNTNPYSKEEQKNQLINIKSVIDELDINKIISIDEMSIKLDEKPPKVGYKGSKMYNKYK